MFILSPKMYDFMKKIVQVGLPAISSLYFSLGGIWGLPAPEKVVGSIAVLCTFLGTVLLISSKTYKALEPDHDGNVVVEKTPDGRMLYSLELNGDPEELATKSSISFKVQKRADP